MTAGSSDRVVVDASIAVKWLILEEHTAEARALARSWREAGVRLAAPQLMPFEVGNALYRRVTAGNLSFEDATRLMSNLMAQGIELYGGSDFYADERFYRSATLIPGNVRLISEATASSQ